MIGAAKMMGYDVEVPPLPVEKVAQGDYPLRAAILAWVAATGASVPPAELERELRRADALPIEVQRDTALLVLSAIEATALQRAALARLTPEQLEWIHTHPEVAEDLANDIDTPETRTLALLSSLVDMPKSIEATLLLLQAVEVTRGTFDSYAARAELAAFETAELDPATKAMLSLLLAADPNASDSEKVMLAARLVALGSGLPLPKAGPAPRFGDALDALLAQTQQVAAPDALAEAKMRAAALPDDLEGAIARILAAEARAVRAASPQGLTATSQTEAMLEVLVATAAALPTLQKYHLYWRDAPDALRMGEWDPTARVAWAAHHASLLTAARGSPADVVRAAALLQGHGGLALPTVPQRSFVDAYLAVVAESGHPSDDALVARLHQAAEALDPALRDASAILLSAAAESTRLQKLAFADLTAEERAFLLQHANGLDALYAKPDLTEAEIARLAHASALAQRVDARSLAAAGVVAAVAMEQAHDLLRGSGAYAAQDADVRPVDTGILALLKRLLPIGSARAQVDTPPPQGECSDPNDFITIDVFCGDDVVLRLRDPLVYQFGGLHSNVLHQTTRGSILNCFGFVDAVMNGVLGLGIEIGPPCDFAFGTECNDRECVIEFGTPNNEVLVIYGTRGGVHAPDLSSFRFICPSIMENGVRQPDTSSPDCRGEPIASSGGPVVSIDLGGADVWAKPVAMVTNNATIPVSLHLDLGGEDSYLDPTSFYDPLSSVMRLIGYNNGHPTAGAAPFGGVAILVDGGGMDSYDAPTRSQGYGRLGLGMLVDLGASADVYTADALSQGAASDSFTLGAGILVESGGIDSYTAQTGQGYGLGGIFLDLGGDDTYRNEHEPNGAPLIHLDIIPGGDVTTLHVRDDARVWLDGPGSLSAGIGVDQDAQTGGPGDSDQDGFSDFVETIVGTDPRNATDSPPTRPAARAEGFLLDDDEDGYPNYVERLLSSDPQDPRSYPAGFPSAVSVKIPATVMQVLQLQDVNEIVGIPDNGTFTADDSVATEGQGRRGSDKILDLRVPVQDAGTIEIACTGEYYLNSTVPIVFPFENIFTGLNPGLVGERDDSTGGARRDNNGRPIERCVNVAYEPDGEGGGRGTLPTTTTQGGPAQGKASFEFQLPVGILAIGDVVATEYANDYFVVIDLGGPDLANSSMGGALAVMTRPVPNETGVRDERVNHTFLAPSVAINVDVATHTQNVVVANTSGDRYVNESRDYAHGSLFSVLLDTAGADEYVARDGSQGALGGLLLDLNGLDTYRARDLSQGASLATAPNRADKAELPAGGNATSDAVAVAPPNGNGVSHPVGTHRRVVPGLLLDLGEHAVAANGKKQTFEARSHSQGFARGFPAPSTTPNQNQQTRAFDNSPVAIGLLVSLDGPDVYDTSARGGRFTQGVGGGEGVGILLDRSGNDTYRAGGLFGQGDTISQSIGQEEPTRNANPRPAAGVLLDVGDGWDTYTYGGGDRTNARNQNTTISRAESNSTRDNEVRVYADVGVHVDSTLDPQDLEMFVAGVGGTGGSSVSASGYEVFLPTARFAIGSVERTVYDRELAFVVDLGGRNEYNFSAAGHIRDYLAQQTNPDRDLGLVQQATGRQAPINLFPVTFLLDAGSSGSNYTSPGGFSQGAGYFGVGVLADLGGRDRFTALHEPLTSLGSTWLDSQNVSPPIIDGSIGADWDLVPEREIVLVAQSDERFTSPWKLRIANDNRSLYVALSGRTMSGDEGERLKDNLTITLDMGRAHEEWNATVGRTGLDQVVFNYSFGAKTCAATDRGRTSNRLWQADPPVTQETLAFTGACRFTEAGEVFYEFRKDLIVTEVGGQPLDLGYCFVEGVGFGRLSASRACETPLDQMGLMVQFNDTGAGYTAPQAQAVFTWPPRTQFYDGGARGTRNADLADEVSRWAAVGLADGLGDVHDGVAPNVSLRPSLAQGAGFAGVGVLAMLGSGGQAELVAGDRAQAFSAFRGVALLLDAGGSDRYVGRERVMGAAQNLSVSIFMDIDGGDNYVAGNQAYGWVPTWFSNTPSTGAGSALFFDLGGDDQYTWAFRNLTQPNPAAPPVVVDAVRDPMAIAVDTFVPPPRGNDMVWSQNVSGIGADYVVTKAIRDGLAAAVASLLWGSTHTSISVTEYVGPETPGAHENGCSMSPVTNGPPGSPTPKFMASGLVCVVATVHTGNGNVNLTARNLAPTLGLFKQLAPASADALADWAAGSFNHSIDVRAVDFFLDRERVTSLLEPMSITSEFHSVWSAPVDLRAYTDGVKRLKAVPTFEAEIELPALVEDGLATTLTNERAVLLFSHELGTPNTDNDTAWSRSLIINNEPILDLGLEPRYSGRANSTFSPYGYGVAQQLYVNWSVSHDADEERLARANGFRAPVWNSSFPCDGVPDADQPQLCHQLPFYLIPANSRPMSTTPSSSTAPTDIKVESLGGEPFASETDVLRDDLHLMKKNSFHVAIPSRLPLLPMTYTTVVEIKVKNESGTVKDATGQEWFLGHGVFETSESAVATPAALTTLLGSAGQTVRDTLTTIDDTFGFLNGNVLWNIANDTIDNRTCANQAVNIGLPDVCKTVNGDPGVGGNANSRPCAKNEPRPRDGLHFWALWYAANAVDRRALFVPTHNPEAAGQRVPWPFPAVPLNVPGDDRSVIVCRSLHDDVNNTLDEPILNSTVSGDGNGTSVGGTPIPEFGGESDTDRLNFTTMWFDANTDTLPADGSGIRVEGDRVIIPGDRDYQIEVSIKLLGGEGQSVASVVFDGISGGLETAATTIEASELVPTSCARDSDRCIDPTLVPSQAVRNLFRNMDVERDVTTTIRGQKTTMDNLDNLAALASGIPASVFFYDAAIGGNPDNQSRISFRVPSEPSTDVKISLQDPITGEDVQILRPGGLAEGDVRGSPTRDGAVVNPAYWEGRDDPPIPKKFGDDRRPHPVIVNWTVGSGHRWTQHNLTYLDASLEGLFLVNVTARDNLHSEGSSRVDTVLIDQTAPRTSITTEPFLGKPLLVGDRVPVRWIATDLGRDGTGLGSGLSQLFVYTRAGDEGDITDITTWERREVPKDARSILVDKDGQTVHLMLTLGVDAAKNVEGSTNAPDLETALAEGFAAKIAQGPNVPNGLGYRRAVIDEGIPLHSDARVEGGRVASFEGSDFVFLRAGQPVTFSICARDLETSISLVTVGLYHIVEGRTENVTFTATAAGSCANGTLYRASGWHLQNADSARFPEGIWTVQFEVFDAGANRVTVPATGVILDHASPRVRVEPPVLPPGQTAVKPGDVVKVRYIADDSFAVDEAGATIDASAFMRGAVALKPRPVRVNGIIYQEASFTVDRTDLQNTAYDVVVKVPDLAGNVTTVRVPIAVNARSFEFVADSFRVTNVTHNSATLHWRTTEPTSAQVKFGTSTIALNGRTPLDTNATTEHAVNVTGLLPSTRYHLRAVSASTGGFVKESEILELNTSSALFLEPLSPAAGDKVSGLVRVAFRGGLRDSADFVSYTLEVREGPSKPWTFVTTATRAGETHDLTWNSTRFLDGTAYMLRLTAEAGRDVASVEIGPFTTDNTPPSVLVMSPLLATNDTTPSLLAETGDSLSGLIADPVRLLIDDVVVDDPLTLTALPDGRLRIQLDLVTPLAAGMRTFELRVQDEAGNVAREVWKVAIDGDAPEISVNPTRFSPGTAAAKAAGTVTLNLTIRDLSGVSQAVADTSALSTTEPSVRLVRLVGTDDWQGTFGVTAPEPNATKLVSVRASDLAGNARTIEVPILVDNLLPNVQATRIEAVNHTRAVVIVPADEPILVTGTATAPNSPADTVSTTEAAQEARVVFAGLLPSRTYTYRLSVTDRAGNEVPLQGTVTTQADLIPPSTVGPLSVLDRLNGTLRLSWAPATDDVMVAFYRVYRSEDDGVTYRVVAEVQGTAHEDAGLPYEKPYVYKVAAVDHGANEGPADAVLRAQATAVPVLSVGAVSPTVGSVGTTFRYAVTYLSPGGVPPAYVRVILDGVPQNMTFESGDAKTGAVYVYETRLAPHKRDAPHTYAFEASDGRYIAKFPTDEPIRGPLVSGDALAGGDLSGFASFAQRVPLGGVAGVGIALLVAVALAAVLSRKKKEGSK